MGSYDLWNIVLCEPTNSEILDLRTDSSSIHSDSKLGLRKFKKSQEKITVGTWQLFWCFSYPLMFVALLFSRCLRIGCRQGNSKRKKILPTTRGALEWRLFL
jgi:hypothetical protein